MKVMMKTFSGTYFNSITILAMALLFHLFHLTTVGKAFSYPIQIEDAELQEITIAEKPGRVVSLVPSVTESLIKIGAGDALVGVTYHDAYPPEATRKPVVGGFFSPSEELIRSASPDLIFIADLHQQIRETFQETDVQTVRLNTGSLSELYRSVKILGKIFGRVESAEKLIKEIHASLDHTAKKIAAVPQHQRKRVLRMMGRETVMTPGDDSFQNEMIRLAGGVPPTLGKSGNIVEMTLDEWKAFNPQVVYGCGKDRVLQEKWLTRPGWRDVDAVRNNTVLYYPCDLTCRMSTRTGYFVSCLASGIYGDHFAEHPPVHENLVTASRPVALPLAYVSGAEIVESRVNDYLHKTLVVHLSAPMSVASTLEGFRQNIRHVGNSYSPPQCWRLYHKIGLETSRNQLLEAIGRDRNDTSLLFTGADMDHLSVQKQQFKEMTVYALVTAGVCSNAVRMGEDVGAFYEPGTINMVILSNMKLSPRAMNRAVISATEAKTAALWDMDIRSAYTPRTNPATGTGTDNIIVVEGAGEAIDNAGGHSKMGELIARAVYAGVREAVYQQNGLIQERHIFRRLKERGISLFEIAASCNCGMTKGDVAVGLERLLLQPRYAGFMESALSLSDAYERKQVKDLSAFQTLCDAISNEIKAQGDRKKKPEEQALMLSEPMPQVLQMAFEALLKGISLRRQDESVLE